MLIIRELRGFWDRRKFVMLPWKVNRGNPNFVPPLISAEMELCNPQKHPFYKEGLGRFFLAERDGVAVGRIAALRNPAYERHWNDHSGFFGFFECAEGGEKGLETTQALLGKAREVLRGWGLARFQGPASPSSNYGFGSLVEGFGVPPKLMMAYNPASYDGLLKGSGLKQSKDLLAFHLDHNQDISRIQRVAARVAERHSIRVRSIDMKKFWSEVGLIKDIYNGAWQYNWGFSPMSDAEFHHMAKEMKDLVDTDLLMFAEIAGKPAAFCMALPDFNEVQIRLNGRLMTPWAFPRLLFHAYVWPKIHSVRILTLGALKEYQHLGIGTLFYVRCYEAGKRHGYHSGEASWILEDNAPMVQALQAMGGRITKRYRIYEGNSMVVSSGL